MSQLVKNLFVKEKGCFTELFAVMSGNESNPPVLKALVTSMMSAAG